MVDSIEFDLIICGSGLAGLRAAIAAAKKGPHLKIGVVSKVQVMRSHSVSAEGGTAAVLFEDEGDTIESHVYDTVKGSDFLADQDVAERMHDWVDDDDVEEYGSVEEAYEEIGRGSAESAVLHNLIVGYNLNTDDYCIVFDALKEEWSLNTN